MPGPARMPGPAECQVRRSALTPGCPPRLLALGPDQLALAAPDHPLHRLGRPLLSRAPSSCGSAYLRPNPRTLRMGTVTLCSNRRPHNSRQARGWPRCTDLAPFSRLDETTYVCFVHIWRSSNPADWCNVGAWCRRRPVRPSDLLYLGPPAHHRPTTVLSPTDPPVTNPAQHAVVLDLSAVPLTPPVGDVLASQ